MLILPVDFVKFVRGLGRENPNNKTKNFKFIKNKDIVVLMISSEGIGVSDIYFSKKRE